MLAAYHYYLYVLRGKDSKNCLASKDINEIKRLFRKETILSHILKVVSISITYKSFALFV